MKKKKNNQTDVVFSNVDDFEIFQYVKSSGIRENEEYESSGFVSPIFGKNVKDEALAPHVNSNLGDTQKKYDVFRDKPRSKNNDKYEEFQGQFANSEVRKVYLGESQKPTEKKPLKITSYRKPEMIAPIMEKKELLTVTKPEVSSAFGVNNDQIPKFVTATPILRHEESLKPDLFSRMSQMVTSPKADINNTIKTSSAFESFNVSKVDLENEGNSIPKNQQLRTFENKSIGYQLPSIAMFSKNKLNLADKPQWLLDQIDNINETLAQFGIDGEVRNSIKGPTVTRYEIELQAGVNVKRVASIQDNLMMNLEVKSLRIEAPIPGKPYVGIEVPNAISELVSFGNVVDDPIFLDSDSPLKIALGVDIDGTNIYADIAKMPHGLIAGATNSGKSVCVNTILASLLVKNKPDDLKLILIDPKMVELTPYNDIPHLITPVITDPRLSSQALAWAVDEMEKRYQIFANSRSRDIKTFNSNVLKGLIKEEKMPHILIIIDELADLMMVAPHDVEDAIQRLTQKARAAGIHLLVATQRPTTDVVKGTIKSNIPTRIAFRVASFVDSTTILDGAGAESLLGRGDMLLKEGDRMIRLQGAYIPDEEIYDLTDYIRAQQKPDYLINHEDLFEKVQYSELVTDDLFEDVAYFVVREQNASINSIQKEFSIGFNRAQKLVEMLEQYNIVSKNQGTKAREVLMTSHELSEVLGHDH